MPSVIFFALKQYLLLIFHLLTLMNVHVC